MKTFAKRGLALSLVLLFVCAMLAAAAVPAAAAVTTARWYPPTVKVELSGKELVEGEFTVTMRRTSVTTDSAAINADGYVPVLPDDRGGASAYTATNDGEGYVTFSPVDFTEEDKGTWTFTIRAIADPIYRDNYAWDMQEVSFKVTVHNSPAIGVYVVANDVPGDITFSATYTEPEDEERGFWTSILGALDDIWDGIVNLGNGFQNLMVWITDIPIKLQELWNENVQTDTNNFLSDGVPFYSNVKSVVSTAYKVFYPFGFLILIISWVGSVFSAGFTLNLELENRNSILRAMLQLFIGLAFLSYAPYAMVLVYAISEAIRQQLIQALQITVSPNGAAGYMFIVFVTQIVWQVNMMRIALLQCIAPLAAGAAGGGEGVRRITANFAKEYILCCLTPAVTTVYFLLVDAMLLNSSVSFFASIALGISIITVGRKTLEKIIH